MDLLSFTTEEKEKITEEWLDALVEIYPEDFRLFLHKNNDKFSNPVGYTLARELPVLLDEIILPKKNSKLQSSLENLMKLMAVQDISPGDSIRFLFGLKSILLKHFGYKTESMAGLFGVFNKIDDTALLAFNIYMKTREKIYEIKANETKSQFGKMVERLNRKYESIVDS